MKPQPPVATPAAEAPVAAAKPVETRARPGFPLRLDSANRPGLPAVVKPPVVSPSGMQRQTPSLRPTQPVLSANTLLAASKPLATFTKRATTLDAQQAAPTGASMASAAMRAHMVHKLAAQGLSDRQVLAALETIERHRFVDSALANQAYEDTSLPIGLGQTISKPNVVARMLELLMQGSAAKLGRVLEIGTGCGYQAALIGQLATEVYSMERLRALHDKARENLRPFRIANVHLIFGDGMLGYPKGAPYAGIIAAAGGEAVPEAWVEQLATGGRLVAPIQAAGGRQALVVIDKTSAGIRQSVLEAVHFVPLKSGTS